MSASNLNKNKAQASQSIIGAGLGAEATSILVKNLSAKTIQGAAGTDPTELPTDMATLALVILDESGSMTDDQDQVVKEFDENLVAIKGSKQAEEILLSVWAFNSKSRMIHSFLTLDLVDNLTDYHPHDETALYDTILDGLTSLVDYEAELRKSGMRIKLNVSVITDGDDNKSAASASDVKKVVTDILAKRENSTFNLIALGNSVDETVMAEEMGFPDPKRFDKTPAGRRRAFGTWSSSVIKTSQTKIGNKSQGGFLAP